MRAYEILRENYYIGNCTMDEIIDDIFGDINEFARAVEERGDEFEIDNLKVTYDEDKDIHSFYMIENKQINEKASRGRPIIAVDIQPAYSGMMDGDEDATMEQAIRFVNDSRAPCLMFVNAEQEGLTSDTIEDVKMYWEDSGFEPENWGRIEVYDKGYGYFRAWMDIGIEDKYIIAVIREMYQQKVSDSRMLFDSDEDKILEYLTPVAESINTEPDTLLDDPLSVGWAAIDQLKRYNNSYLIGGGRQECLKEVALLMNAFNIKYKMIDELIYGQ